MIARISSLVLAVAITASGAESYAAPVAEPGQPKCVTMVLVDKDNLPVKTDQPVVGIMVGEVPVVEPIPLPPHVGRAPGAAAVCPPALLAALQSTFEQNCMLDNGRKKTGKDFNIDSAQVSQGCMNLKAALAGQAAPAQKSAPSNAPPGPTTAKPQR